MSPTSLASSHGSLDLDSTTHAENPAHAREREGVLALAGWYMARKGNEGRVPVEITRMPNLACWYVLYDLADGELELEVYYDPMDGWQTKVTTFAPHRR